MSRLITVVEGKVLHILEKALATPQTLSSLQSEVQKAVSILNGEEELPVEQDPTVEEEVSEDVASENELEDDDE